MLPVFCVSGIDALLGYAITHVYRWADGIHTLKMIAVQKFRLGSGSVQACQV